MLLAVHTFGGKQGVQHRVAGLVLGLIAVDVAFHLGQCGVLLDLVALGTNGRNLHFQLMVAAVNQADVLFALLVLLILAVQDVIHRRQLAVQRRLPQLLMLDAQNQHARKVYQRADVEHHDCDLVPRDEAQIAYGKDRHCHYHRHQHGGGGNDQPGRNLAATLKTEQKTVDHRIDHRQQQQGQRRSGRGTPPAVRRSPP